ncbi:MDR family MFS transporter [Aspergillus undulatus]|uniref:MDR family MFS transporter n=1 Tax=Aspergillus undulatus TaxID=1810928 RepID=UPI003CCD105B
MFITALDQTITATSIPSISASLRSAAGYTWIGSAYLLATAASGPIWVRISDIFGRKPALLASVLDLAVGSVVAATAHSMRVLIAARALQGAGAGGVNQLVYVTISDLFSIRDRALWFGGLGGIWAVAGSAGPVLGGALTERLSWRWCFWINLPACGVPLILLLACLNVHNPRTKLKEGVLAIDWLGTVTVVGLTVLLLLGMEFGGVTFPWDSPTVICMIIFGGVMVGLFVVVEKRFARFPLVLMGLFSNGFFIAPFILSFAHGMVALGVEYYLPLYFQSVKQASPLQSGLYILPVMVTEALTDILAGIFLHRVGRYRELTWVGVSLMALGTGLLVSIRVESPIGMTIGFAIIGGIGTALLFQTPVIAVQNAIEKKTHTASATATLGFLKSIAAGFSIVLGGVMFRDGMERQQGVLKALGVDEEILSKLTGDMAAANVEVVSQIADPGQRKAVRGAFAWSLRNMFIFYTAISGVAVLAGCFVKQKGMSKEHTETKTGLTELEEGKK